MKKHLLLIAGLALAFTTLPLAAQSAGNGKGPKNPNPPANCDGSNGKGSCLYDGQGRGRCRRGSGGGEERGKTVGEQA